VPGSIVALIIGVISDTHGLLRPQAVAALRSSDLIVHAGDIGTPDIIPELACIAPVTAVRGNVDRDAWAAALPETAVVAAGEVSCYVLHDRNALDLKPGSAGFAAVISGHSHVPAQELRDGVLYFNPGSAGPRRFRLPVSVGRLMVNGKNISGELIYLDV
jgi:hypothetical protein